MTALVKPTRIRLIAQLALTAACLLPAAAPAAPPEKPVTLADYRTRLESLDHLVAACQASIDASHCKSSEVGPDTLVLLPPANTARTVEFAWLRDLLDKAAKPDSNDPSASPKLANPRPSQPSVKPPSVKQPASEKAPVVPISVPPVDAPSEEPPPTLANRLQIARDRLREDWQRAGQLSTPAPPAHANESKARDTLAHILTAREYQTAIAQRSLRDRLLEKLNAWLLQLFAKLSAVGARAKWIGLLAEIAFVTALLVALVWFLIRLERQGRFWATSIAANPNAAAASARDWQLWLEDANRAAATGAWRDAIRLTYWASISRLESTGLWPADRARTPREYLALLGDSSNQRPDLKALTRSFERTWYAGRDAAEADFERARQLAARLGARPGARPVARPGAR